MITHYLACDLGAESGRVILGSLHQQTLSLQELHRFDNVPLHTGSSLHWNLPCLMAGIKTGLARAAQLGLPIAGVSCDTWGLDYILLRPDGSPLEPAFHYRDPRSADGVKKVLARVPWETVFAETGIQFMPINTLYHLAMEEPAHLRQAAQLLPIGDAFNYFLSGVARAEVSLASTTQLYNPRTGTWSAPLLSALGLTPDFFPPLIPSGTLLGPLTAQLTAETGLASCPVLATCSHDTGAAIAAVPVREKNWAYLSSGTWSLMGVERDQPLLSDQCRALNFTNEIGYGGSVRLLKNVSGLWLVQECRRHWAKQGKTYDYDTLTQMAASAPSFTALINPMDPRFLAPDNLPEKIEAFCWESGQVPPKGHGAMLRCIFESLALLYAHTFKQLQSLHGPIECLHIVGGGSKNILLNQFTANALQLPVLAGPVEATAIGNILIQAITLGHLPSLQASREVVRNSFPTDPVQPQSPSEWRAAQHQFAKICHHSPPLGVSPTI